LRQADALHTERRRDTDGNLARKIVRSTTRGTDDESWKECVTRAQDLACDGKTISGE
jgi:hypothetical protein